MRAPTPEAPSSPAPGLAAAPRASAYTPRHLAEKILAERHALTGERKQVTILFADVVGSTELVRDLDPEEAQQLLDGAVQRMMSAVHRYEGTVSRLQGDGLMAMFGAPIAHEDHAVRACYAALAMLDAAGQYARDVQLSHGAPIQIRVGLNSGEVIVRLISDDLHMDYTAMGQTVHLASRMESLAVPGTALLSPATLALVEGFVEAQPRGPVPVRGLDEPIEVHELTGASAARTRVQASAGHGLTPFVGRDRERAAVDQTLAQARAGRGQVVAIVADAGMGKSRLVWEVARAHEADGLAVLQSGALSYGQSTPWLPVSSLLRTYFQIESRDDHGVMHTKVAAGLHALGPDLDPGRPALLSLLDVPVDDAGWADLDPAQRRRATLDAIRHLLLRESQRRPLLLVFEDLHWVDSESQALLDGLVEALPASRIVLLVNYRPEYSHTWGSKSYYTQLRLDPLTAESTDELLAGLIGDDASVEPLKRVLFERTEGTPLFLEESVRSLVETGALIGERGARRMIRPADHVRVPATVQAVLAARIDRLAASEKRLLQTASAIGKDVPFRLLQAIAETPEADLHTDLARLQAAELLYPVSLFPEPEYTFKHALTHDVAYGSLLQERRRELHRRIVDAIERLYADRLDELVERLAHHALAGEIWPQALAYCERAGDRSIALAAYNEGVLHFERALRSLGHIQDRDRRTATAIDLRVKLRNALFSLGDFRGGVPPLIEAEQLADSVGDQRRVAAISILLSSSYINLGQPDDALGSIRRALEIAEDLDDLDLRVAANWMLGSISNFAGAHQDAADIHRRNLDTLGWDRRFESLGQVGLPAVTVRANLIWSLTELGGFDEGVAVIADAFQISDDANHPYSLSATYGEGINLHLARGDLAEAIRLGERGVEICELRENRAYWRITTARLGYAYVLDGRIDEGISLLRRACDQFAASGHRGQEAPALTYLAHALLMTDHPDEALDVAQRAFAIGREYAQPAREAHALRILGEIAAHGGSPELARAERSFLESLTLAERHGMRPLQAHCHLGLGMLCSLLGRLEMARSELGTAVAMLRDMDMTFWLPDAESALASVSAR